MIQCGRCDKEIKHGEEYKIAYNTIWCIRCTKLTDGEFDDTHGEFGETYIREFGGYK
jgi:hypothetical protein